MVGRVSVPADMAQVSVTIPLAVWAAMAAAWDTAEGMAESEDIPVATAGPAMEDLAAVTEEGMAVLAVAELQHSAAGDSTPTRLTTSSHRHNRLMEAVDASALQDSTLTDVRFTPNPLPTVIIQFI